MTLTLLLLACAGDKPSDSGAAADCAALDPTTCATREDCSTIDGRPLQDDGSGGVCVDYYDEPVPLGCMSAEGGCGAAETGGLDGDGTCWWFSSTCLPSGWTSCEFSVVDECP